MIEAGLFNRIKTQVTAVGNRVYPKVLPQNVQTPAITYELITDPRGNTHQGPDGTVEALYQVTVWAKSYMEAKTISLSIKNALQGFSGAMGTGVTVASVFAGGGRDLFDDDLRLYFIPADFIIHYKEQ
jgi:hypothetical protein